MNQYNLNYAVKQIQLYIGERELVFFGKQDEMFHFFENQGYTVTKIFTRVTSSINPEEGIYDAAGLAECVAKYYIFCPYRSTDNERYLIKCGFQENIDYVFYQPARIVLKNVILPYEDKYGNYVSGKGEKVSLVLEGFQNKIQIDNSMVNGHLSVWCLGSGNTLECHKTKWTKDCNVALHGNENHAVIGKCNMNTIKIRCWGYSEIHIADHCSFEEYTEIITSSYTRISLGTDCMVAREVIIQAGDAHAIYNVLDEKVTNQNRTAEDNIWNEINIGEHVWIGRRTFVLGGGGTYIGNGSIAGAMSFVKGRFPNNVVLAGIPAKVIRKNVAWDRNGASVSMEGCNGYIELTQEG